MTCRKHSDITHVTPLPEWTIVRENAGLINLKIDMDRRGAFQWVLRQSVDELAGRRAIQSLKYQPPVAAAMFKAEYVFGKFLWLKAIKQLWPAYRKALEELRRKKLTPRRQGEIQKFLLVVEVASLAKAGSPVQDMEACVTEWIALEQESPRADGSKADPPDPRAMDRSLRDLHRLLDHYHVKQAKTDKRGSRDLFWAAHRVLLREVERRRILEGGTIGKGSGPGAAPPG